MAQYYMCTEGEVLKAALPAGLKLESETLLVRNADFDAAGYDLTERDERLLQALDTERGKKITELEKELGLWGKDSSCYIGEGGKKLSESRALQYARSGSVEIELALMDLLSATSCVSAGFVARS